MTRPASMRRWIAHAVVLVLLLKAAVPLMASAAAGLQGKPVADICDLYGVALPKLPGGLAPSAGEHAHAGHVHPGGGHEKVPAHGGKHGAEHCALSALATFAAPDGALASFAVADDLQGHEPRARQGETSPSDASARWAARLRHAPPRVS